MDRYQTLKQLGDGTYGSVLLGKSRENGEMVAIKKMKKKYYSWDECVNLREVKSLKKLSHANVIKLKEVVRENDQLFFIFEYMKENLYQMMKDRDKLFPESSVRNIIYQILQGLAFIHKHGFFHRDMKPENLLCSGPELIKIADFGLAREIRSRPPYTDYVSTRWYRAPEVLLRSTSYGAPIDIWAIGCIMAELYTLRPLFPGSSEIDEIFKICSVLGTPKREDWPEGFQLANSMSFKFPQCVSISLKTLIPNANHNGLQLVRDMLHWNPQKRPTAAQALKYPYFQVGQSITTNITSTSEVRPLGQQNPRTEPKQPPLVSRYSGGGGGFGFTPPTPEQKKTVLPVLAKAEPKPVRGSANTNSREPSLGAKSGGRRQWAKPHPPQPKPVKDTWDFDDDLDFSFDKKPVMAPQPPEKKKLASFDWDDDDDLFGSINKKPVKKANLASSGKRMEPLNSPISSAKQHYLRQARYIPGIIPKSSAKKESPSGFGKPLAGLTITNNSFFGAPRAGGGYGRRAEADPLGNPGGAKAAPSGYIPSFQSKKEPAAVSDYSSWKPSRAAAGLYGATSGKASAGLRPQPVHGRTDWTSKYGGHR